MSVVPMKNNIISYSNKLTEARYFLTPTEQKIVFSMISLIQPSDEDFKTYHMSINDLSEFIGINRTNAVREIDKATDRLMSRVLRISIEDGSRLLKLHWVSHCILDNATFEFSFHSKMKPYLLQFKKYFTSYQQKIIIQFSSSYTIRIYQLLKCWEFKGSFEYSVSEFREILGISTEKYKQFKAFKYWVITHAKKELEKKDPKTGLYKSDVSFTLETRRTGRKISHLKFTIKPQKIVATPKNSITKEDIAHFSNDERYILDKMLLIGIAQKKSRSLIKKYPLDYLTEKLALVDEKQKITGLKNASGFLIKAIEENWENEVTSNDKPTKVLKIPNISDGSQLQTWAVSNGLPAAPAGMDTYQYRQMLHNTLERMRVAEERKQVGD